MSEQKAIATLQKALALLGPNGENWGNPSLKDCFCVLTALGSACGVGISLESSVLHAHIRDNYLAAAIGRRRSIVAWNDATERTWPEVKAVYEKAIQLAEAS